MYFFLLNIIRNTGSGFSPVNFISGGGLSPVVVAVIVLLALALFIGGILLVRKYGRYEKRSSN